MTDAVAQALEAAKNAAANIVPQGDAAPATYAPARGAPATVDDMLTGSMSVDNWLKCNEHGLFIGDDKKQFDELKLALDFGQIGYFYGVRFGNPPQYEKSFDRVVSEKGRPWGEVLVQAQKIDSRASEYKSADLPFIVTEDIVGKSGAVLMKAGEILGHSLSITGFKPFQNLLRRMVRDGQDIHGGVYSMTVGFEEKSAKGFTWGILSFSDLEDYDG